MVQKEQTKLAYYIELLIKDITEKITKTLHNYLDGIYGVFNLSSCFKVDLPNNVTNEKIEIALTGYYSKLLREQIKTIATNLIIQANSLAGYLYKNMPDKKIYETIIGLILKKEIKPC